MTRIRILETGDEALLAAACRIHLDEDVAHERRALLLADPAFVAVAALDEAGAPIGLVYGHELNRPIQTDLLIYSVDVGEAHRGRGVGKAMIQALVRLGEARGWGEMWVLTNASNTAAMRLYESSGGVRDQFDVEMFAFPLAAGDRIDG